MSGIANLHYLDVAIVGGYLIACLVVGLMKFGQVKTLKDYTLGTRPFSNTLLFATIFATAIGLKATVGAVEKSYALGLVFIIPLLLLRPLMWVLISKLLSPNLDLFKQQHFMTLSDMMEYWYGSAGKWVSSLCSIGLAIAVSAASVTAIGYLCSHFLGMSPIYGELIAVIVITVYSALGGVQAVIYTDLLQMLVFFVALPVICAIGLSKAGGIEHIFHSLPATHLAIDRSNIVLFLSFVVYGLLPTTGIPYIQRALIAKDKAQLSQAFEATGLGSLFFLTGMTLIGLAVYTINPNISPNTALYYFMSNYLCLGVLGLVIAGVLAVIMSSQDSYVNAASSLIPRDICKQIWPSLTDKSQLIIARISCVAIIITGTSISFAKDSVLGIFWMIENFWDPLVTIPLMSGLLGIKILKKDFVRLTIACIVAVVCARAFTGTFDTRSHSVGAITSFLALYIANRRFKALHPEANPSRIPEILAHLKEIATTHVFNPGAVYIFSLASLLGLIASIFILPSHHELLALHVTGAALCVLLLFNELWSKKIHKLWLQKIWHLTLLICLPLSCSYPLFAMNLSSALVINFILSLALLYILVSPLMFLTLAAFGTGLSYAAATVLHIHFVADVSTSTFGVYSCFFTTIIIMMQIYNKRYVSKEILKVKDDMNERLKSVVDERTVDLQDALAAKKEFLGKVGHEVRTPLQGIIAISKQLAESWQNLGDAQKHDMANTVANNGNRLMGLMNNILDLSQFSVGKIQAVFNQDVDIANLIENAIKIGETIAEGEHKDIIFKTEIDASVKRKIECDSTRMTQVLINLISNAINYSNSGEVTIRASDADGKLKVSVSDNGVGIPEKELTMIFEAFTQSSRTKDPSKGKGLGLAICNEIIGLHHGHIWAENNKNKPGSTFSFIIPYKQEVVKAETAVSQSNLTSKVLLVDDEEICLQTGDMCLSTLGLEVVTAKGGVPALKYLKAHPNEIDLVLLDLMMPDMYGINVLEEIKADPNLKHIPVVIQSGLLDPQEIAKAQKLGAAGHLPKPYNKDALYGALQKLLKQKELMDAA